ncbi:MAG: hypothetical protein RI953_281 [Pseudomonadota bacterium]|jgi:hypothetical protein
MKAHLSAIFGVLALLFTACGRNEGNSSSQLASQTTLNWNFSATSAPVATFAESGNCATNLPQTLIVSNYCFNEVPVAVVSATLEMSGLVALCVATHASGSVSEAALLVVDDAGQYVAESMGKGGFQVLATVAGNGRYKVYVGFPSAAAGQRVKVLGGLSRQFTLTSSACTLR